MQIKALATGKTDTGPEALVQINAKESDEMMVQVEITGGSATIDLEGRTDPTMPWVTLVEFTSDGLLPFPVHPQIRLNVTANTGTVNANVAYRSS